MCLSILSEWVEVLPMGWKIKICNTLKKIVTMHLLLSHTMEFGIE